VKALTLVLPYYRNGSMLREHQRVWRSYHPDLRRRLHVIVVDDGSPVDPAVDAFEPVEGLASQRLYRIGVDVRWNWLTCRNLGVDQALSLWVLLTDIDHVLPAETLASILDGDWLDGVNVYRLSRVDAPNLTPYKPHPNTWLLTRKMFDRIGGYDERFSGYYGSDAEFRERVQKHARAIVMRPEAMVRYPREVIADASTTVYGRKEEQDGIHIPRIREQIAKDPKGIKRLSFPWERLR
jgi:hypothetical protein